MRTPEPRDFRQLAKLSDDQILGSDKVDKELWPSSAAEVHVRVSEYHLKHNKPAPTTSSNPKSKIIILRRKYIAECQAAGGFPDGHPRVSPQCKGAENITSVCSVDEKCPYHIQLTAWRPSALVAS
jgi:hypothetical protein